jgi:predicted nuclease of predicted toxin-antitoxin system
LRLLLDEQISPDVAYRLSVAGFDVVCARDRGLLGFNDWTLFHWCIERGFAICTKNSHDFEAEHYRAMARGEHHPGVLLILDWDSEVIFQSLLKFLSDWDDSDLTDQLISVPRSTE